MDKQVYELTEADVLCHPVWYFPMDDTTEDEATVRAVESVAEVPDHAQVIVACRFQDALGRAFTGYAYVGEPPGLEYAKPVLWSADGLCVSFWNGLRRPDDGYLREVARCFPPHAWPVTYASTVAALPIGGTLAAVYCFDDIAGRVTALELPQ